MKSVASKILPFSLAALCALTASTVKADTKPTAAPSTAKAPLLSENFDELIPGSTPKNWSVLWGQQGEDQLSVSNLQSVSADNSILIDRVASTEKSHYGVGTRFPSVKTGWGVTSFDIRLEGKPSSIRLGVEMRGVSNHPNTNVLGLELFGNRIDLLSSDHKTRVTAGNIEADKWYRVVLQFPTKGGEQTSSYATLKERTEAGEWKAIGTPQTVPALAPTEDIGHILFNVHPDKKEFKVFIDNFQVEQNEGFSIQ